MSPLICDDLEGNLSAPPSSGGREEWDSPLPRTVLREENAKCCFVGNFVYCTTEKLIFRGGIGQEWKEMGV